MPIIEELGGLVVGGEPHERLELYNSLAPKIAEALGVHLQNESADDLAERLLKASGFVEGVGPAYESEIILSIASELESFYTNRITSWTEQILKKEDVDALIKLFSEVSKDTYDEYDSNHPFADVLRHLHANRGILSAIETAWTGRDPFLFGTPSDVSLVARNFENIKKHTQNIAALIASKELGNANNIRATESAVRLTANDRSDRRLFALSNEAGSEIDDRISKLFDIFKRLRLTWTATVLGADDSLNNNPEKNFPNLNLDIAQLEELLQGAIHDNPDAIILNATERATCEEILQRAYFYRAQELIRYLVESDQVARRDQTPRVDEFQRLVRNFTAAEDCIEKGKLTLSEEETFALKSIWHRIAHVDGVEYFKRLSEKIDSGDDLNPVITAILSLESQFPEATQEFLASKNLSVKDLFIKARLSETQRIIDEWESVSKSDANLFNATEARDDIRREERKNDLLILDLKNRGLELNSDDALQIEAQLMLLKVTAAQKLLDIAEARIENGTRVDTASKRIKGAKAILLSLGDQENEDLASMLERVDNLQIKALKRRAFQKLTSAAVTERIHSFDRDIYERIESARGFAEKLQISFEELAEEAARDFFKNASDSFQKNEATFLRQVKTMDAVGKILFGYAQKDIEAPESEYQKLREDLYANFIASRLEQYTGSAKHNSDPLWDAIIASKEIPLNVSQEKFFEAAKYECLLIRGAIRLKDMGQARRNFLALEQLLLRSGDRAKEIESEVNKLREKVH